MTEFAAVTPTRLPAPPDTGEAAAPGTDDSSTAASEALLREQIDAGLDEAVVGAVAADAPLAAPLLAAEGVEATDAGGPVVTAPPESTGYLADAFAAVPDDARPAALLPGPYTLSTLSADAHFGSFPDLLDALADFLAAELAAVDPVTVHLTEPALVADPPGDGPDARVSEAIDRIAADRSLVVHAPGGPLTEKVHAHMLDADVAALGYDFVADHEANRYNVNEYGTRDRIAMVATRGEADAETVRERIAWLQAETPAQTFDRIDATAAGLDDLAWPDAREALDSLAAGTRRRECEVED